MSIWSAPLRRRCARPTTTRSSSARVYVDTRAGAPKEGGDIAQPLKSGVLKKDGIRGDLFELCRGKAKGRTKASEITLFKSVGTRDRGSGGRDAGVAGALELSLTARQSALEPRPPWHSSSKSAGFPTPETLDVALDAGADMVGFVFFAASARATSRSRRRARSARA